MPDTSTIAIPAADSPTGSAIIEAPTPVREAPEIHMPTGAAAPAGVKISKVDVARELGLKEAPSEIVKREAQEVRDRLGRFTGKKTEAPKAKEPAAPVVAPKLGEPDPKPPVEAKIKIGTEEKTAAEWEAHYKELRDKAEAAAKPPEPTAPPVAGQTDEEIAAATKAAKDAWFAKATEGYAPTQEEFDAMLANGDTKTFGRYLATAEDNAYQRFVAAANPAFEKQEARIAELEAQQRPIFEQHQQVAQYQTEQQFMGSNPTIGAHPKGLQTMRETSADLHAEHDDLVLFITQNPNSPRVPLYQARCKELEGENFLPALAKATAERLGTVTAPATAAPAPAKPAAATPAPPKPRPAPPTGNLGGTAVARAGGDPEAAAMRARGLL